MTTHWPRPTLTTRVNWTQWFVGVWWWPIAKDRAFGINLGPVSFVWERRDHR